MRRLLPLLAFLLTVHAHAAVPDRVPFQGFLATSSGAPAAGTYALTVRVFDAQTGGAKLYEQAAGSVSVSGGLFDLELGPLPASVTAGASRWVEIQVEAEAPLPRRPLLGAAFALQAGRADVAALAEGVACSGCVGQGAIASGAIKAQHLGVSWAAGAGAGGDATGLACSGCVDATDLAAGSVGTVALQDGGVASADVAFSYAGSASKGGAASDVACTGCIHGADVAANLEVTGSFAADGSTFFVDGAANRVGVGTNAPGGTLHVVASTAPALRLAQGGSAAVIEGGDGSSTTFTVAKTGAVTAKALDLGGGSLTSFRAHPAASPPTACGAGNAGQIYFDTANKKFMGCDGTDWLPLSGGAAGPGSSQSLAGRDCVDLKELGVQTSGVYWIDPNGGTQADAFPAYCEMETDGGGWTMCYTDNGEVRIQSQTTFTQASPYGTDGYRTACGSLDWSEVLYVNHTANQKAWFKRDIDQDLSFGTTGYSNSGGSFGSWTGFGVASTSIKYQVMVCDTTGLFGGIMTTGFNGCWKECNNWCNDGSATYFRTDADSGGSFNGVAFNENGHTNVSTKLMSVGLRRARPFADAPSNTKDTPAASCLALRNGGIDTDGYYWLDPNGGSAADSFLAYCDMTTDGGGWTMCHTDGAEVHAKTEVAFSMAGAFGYDGYRSDCRNIPFNNVLYVNHDNGQKAWFKRDTAGTLVAGSTNWFTSGSSYGLWTGYGATNTGYKYQLLLCDNGWMWTGFFISGYTSCWKACNSWCSDHTTPYYRYDGDDGGSYNGVSFNQNGHTNVSYKTMSVGIR